MNAHTPTPWTYRDAAGAGLQILGAVQSGTGIDLPAGMPEVIHFFQLTSPQNIQIACERWVQSEPKGWSEMQEANAAFIVRAVNAHDDMLGFIKRLDAWWTEEWPAGPDDAGCAFRLTDETIALWREMRAAIAKATGADHSVRGASSAPQLSHCGSPKATGAQS